MSNNPDSPASDHDEENDEANNNEDLFDVDGAAPEKRRKINAGLQERIFETKKWVQVPTAIAEKTSEPKYLADRRSGMESLYGGAYKATHGFGSLGLNPGAGSGAAGFDLGDGSGLGNAAGVLGGNAPPEPAPVRKNMPPRRKKKKLGGPGRRKAVPVITGESNLAATQIAGAEVVMGDSAAEGVDDSSQPGYNAAGDGGDGDGSGSDSEGEGSEEGEIDEGAKSTLENNPTTLDHSEVEPMLDTHADGTGLMASVPEVAMTEAEPSADKLGHLTLPQDTTSMTPTLVEASEMASTTDPMSIDTVTAPETASELEGLPQTSIHEAALTADGNPPTEVDMSLATDVATSAQLPSLSESLSIPTHEPQLGPAATVAAPIIGSPISTLNEANLEQMPTLGMPDDATEHVPLQAAPPVVATDMVSLVAPTTDVTPPSAATDPVAEVIEDPPISAGVTGLSQPDLTNALPVVVGGVAEVEPDSEPGLQLDVNSGPGSTSLEQPLDDTTEHAPAVPIDGVVESAQPPAESLELLRTPDVLTQDQIESPKDTVPIKNVTESTADNETASNVVAGEVAEQLEDGVVSATGVQSGPEGEAEMNEEAGLDLLGGLEKAVDLEAAGGE